MKVRNIMDGSYLSLNIYLIIYYNIIIKIIVYRTMIFAYLEFSSINHANCILAQVKSSHTSCLF